MSGVARNPEALPQIRTGLIIQSVSEQDFIIKRPDSKEYFSVGAAEAFLLQCLDGTCNRTSLKQRYQTQFQEPLLNEDLSGFLEMAAQMGLLQPGRRNAVAATVSAKPEAARLETGAKPPASDSQKPGRQSLLYFRVPLVDPDNFLNWLAGSLSFVFTRAFVTAALLAMVFALAVMLANSRQLFEIAQATPGWGDIVWFLIVMVACTILHEIAHGVTLRHFGGQVHECGILVMFFTPCLYCNVSDAWLLPGRWHRLAVTAAGSFCDLCLWATGVFVWRLTEEGTAVSQTALIVMTVCGGRSLINLNPLLRLDGYYLLSDFLAIPNLRSRALTYWMAHVRWIVWGAARPPSDSKSRTLLCYGFVCWAFAIIFLDFVLIQIFQYLGRDFGIVGLITVTLLAGIGFRRVFTGFNSGELRTMIQSRPKRTMIYSGAALIGLAAIFLVPVPSNTAGTFEVRPDEICQVHTAVEGVVEQVLVEDGETVQAGQAVARLRSAALESDIAQAEDILREIEAGLFRLKTGARQEEKAAVAEQVLSLKHWVRLGEDELNQARVVLQENQSALRAQIETVTARIEDARSNLRHSEFLASQGALSGAQLRRERLSVLQLESELVQLQASESARRVLGTTSLEAELARREQELGAAEARLVLLQAGARSEDIAAEEARLARARHELDYLQSQRKRLEIVAPVSGVFSAPRLKERIGQAIPKHTLFCAIENSATSRVEIAVAEEQAVYVKPGQSVRLKARAMPFESFYAGVESISATAQKSNATGNVVVVVCRIRNPDGRLKSGMTGSARIARGWSTVGVIMLTQVLQYVRTEFWF